MAKTDSTNRATFEHTLPQGCLGTGSKSAGLLNLDAELSTDYFGGIHKLAQDKILHDGQNNNLSLESLFGKLA